MTHALKTLFLIMITTLAMPAWAEEEGSAKPTAIYYAIEEPFTINFLNQSNKKVRYLQIKVTLKSTDQEAIDGAEQNLPMIQDALLDIFSDQSYEQATTVEGRVALQELTLSTIKTILEEETGNDDIDAVYFTSFILQ